MSYSYSGTSTRKVEQPNDSSRWFPLTDTMMLNKLLIRLQIVGLGYNNSVGIRLYKVNSTLRYVVIHIIQKYLV